MPSCYTPSTVLSFRLKKPARPYAHSLHLVCTSAEEYSPLDGLNKPYGHASVRYYREIFNHLSKSQGGNVIDWERVSLNLLWLQVDGGMVRWRLMIW